MRAEYVHRCNVIYTLGVFPIEDLYSIAHYRREGKQYKQDKFRERRGRNGRTECPGIQGLSASILYGGNGLSVKGRLFQPSGATR